MIYKVTVIKRYEIEAEPGTSADGLYHRTELNDPISTQISVEIPWVRGR